MTRSGFESRFNLEQFIGMTSAFFRAYPQTRQQAKLKRVLDLKSPKSKRPDFGWMIWCNLLE